MNKIAHDGKKKWKHAMANLNCAQDNREGNTLVFPIFAHKKAMTKHAIAGSPNLLCYDACS